MAQARSTMILRWRPKKVEEKIKENLKPLETNVAKKIAQEAYYSNLPQLGNSPMIRGVKRESVHDRLGTKQPSQKRMRLRVPFTGTNTQSILPKLKRKNFKTRPNSQRFLQGNIAQARLERIRRQISPKPVKLRRYGMQNFNSINPTSYTIQVKNNHNQSNAPNVAGRFKILLTPQYQQEIKALQMSSTSPMEFNFLPPDTRAIIQCTKIPVNMRFASYMG